jgi:transposase
MEERRGKTCGPGQGRPRKKPRPPEEENPLVAENRRLRMEIEYLKKLNALVLANERARKNKRK